MLRRAGIALSVALFAPLTLSPMAQAQGTPVDPRPAPGMPSDTNADLRRVQESGAAASGPTRPDNAMTMAQYRAQKLTWSAKTCTPATKALVKATKGAAAIECARLKAPLSWSDLSKGSITINVSRIKASARGARTLFVNPGGPGGEAGSMTGSVALTKPVLHRTHNIVGVDPRGTGGSTPLPCDSSMLGLADSRVATPAVRRAAQAAQRSFVQKCVAKQGKYLPHITTANTVADQDLVRQLMVGPKTTVDWYGISGGSWMGAWFAQLHPKSLGRVVLDANTEFTADWRTSFAHYPAGFQRRFEGQVLPWVARQNRQFKAGTTTKAVKAAYERIRAAAGKGKVAGMRPDDVDSLSALLMYDDSTLPLLGTFIGGTDAQLRKKGKAVPALPEEFLASLQQYDPSMVTVRTAIICNDTAYTRTPASYEQEFAKNLKANPLTAGMHYLVMGACASWPYKPAAAPKIGTAGPNKLMVQTEFDPATPLEGARNARRADKRTRLLTVAGQGGHGGFLTPNACVDKVVTGYLTKGVMPSKDLRCAGLPLPGEKKVFRVTWRR